MARTTTSPQFARNYGFWNQTEQQALLDAHVAIAGVGGDGFQLGQKLAMMGVQHFSVADPEVFEPENVNRVPGARTSTIGKKKAEVFKDTILDINPDASVKVFTDGVTADNVEEWMHGATLSYDESELTYPHIGTMVAREARRLNIPNVLVMNIGFAAQVTSFDPESRATFERIMGFADDMPLDEVAEQKIDFSRCLPYLPTYVDLGTFKAVSKGSSLPSIAPGVDQASAIGASQGFLHIVGPTSKHRPQPVWAPRFKYIDSLTNKTGETRFPRISHYKHLAGMATRTALRMNTPLQYGEDLQEVAFLRAPAATE